MSHVRLFATPWTIQSIEFSKPEYWSGQPFPSPEDLPNPGIETSSPVLQADSLPAESQGKPLCVCVCVCVCIHTSTLLHNDCPNEDTDLKLYLKALMEKQKTNKQKNPQGYNCLSKPKFSILLNKVYFHTSNSS